jgi:hypothetical protein
VKILGLIAVATSFLLPATLPAQAKSTASPTEVAREFFNAQSDGRWLDAARLLDLRSFERYRQNAIRDFRLRKGFAGPTPEQVMEREPGMPRAVAEYVAGKYAGLADSDALSTDFARTTSPEELAAIPLDEAAARWLEARDPRWQLERSRTHLPPGCQRPPVLPTVKPPPNEALGEVFSGLTAPGGADTLSYVVFRDPTISRGAPGLMPPGVLTLTSVNGQWKILPLPDVGFAGGLRSFPGFGCVKVGVQPSR